MAGEWALCAQTDESSSGPFPLCSVLLALFEPEGDCVIGLGRLVCNCDVQLGHIADFLYIIHICIIFGKNKNSGPG